MLHSPSGPNHDCEQSLSLGRSEAALSSCLPITWSNLHSVHESSNVYDCDSPTALGLSLSSPLCRVLVLALEKKRKKPWTNNLTTVACWRHNDSSYSALRDSLTLNTKRMMRGAHYLSHVYNITFVAKNDEKQLPKAILCLQVQNLVEAFSSPSKWIIAK